MMKMNRNKSHIPTLGLSIALLAFSSTAWAWEVKSYYPSPLEPTLPDASQARQAVIQTPWVLRAVRQAHQQSMQNSWKSVNPPVTPASNATP